MAAYQRAQKLRDEGVSFVAASTDPLDEAKGTVDSLGLSFPVGYGLELKSTAAKIGAFYDEEKNILHSTNFLLDPDRAIRVAVYSTGPLGRLVWQDVLSAVQFYKSQAV